MKSRPVRWSAQAIRNLKEISGRIATDAPIRALSFAKRLLDSAKRLGAFPESGRKVPELADQTPQPREIIVSGYRVLYRLNVRDVEIVAVVHGRRLLPG